MNGRDQKIAIGASLLMTFSVAINMAVFQKRDQGSAIETGGLPARNNWIEGPGTSLSPSGPGFGAPPENGTANPAVPPAASEQNDVNFSEITRGIQRELGARGYDAGQPDGVVGLVTRAGIFAYEYDNGLVLTGRPSEPLLSQIVLGSSSLQQNGARPGKTISADGESLVRSVKQQLAGLGYQAGAANGTLTPELARAIREFESDQKLKPSGRISGPVMSRLIRLQGQPKARRNSATRTSSR